MSNNNNNNNDLASPDDTTSELELPTWRHDDVIVQNATLEIEADTFGLAQRETATDGSVKKLTLELEKQRALIRGLEAERDSRIQIISDLQTTIGDQDAAQEALQSRVESLETKRRKQRKKATSLRQKNSELQDTVTELETALDAQTTTSAELSLRLDETVETLSARDHDLAQLHAELDVDRQSDSQGSQALVAAYRQDIRDLKAALRRNESLTDSIRQQLDDVSNDARELARDNTALRESLAATYSDIAEKSARIGDLETLESATSRKLKTIEQDHAEEIRIIRFELTEAEQSIGQHELINEQLASDLVDSRTQKHTLESQLTEIDSSAQSEISRLEHEFSRTKRLNTELKERLANRSEVIQSLLEELAGLRNEAPQDDHGRDDAVPVDDDSFDGISDQDKMSRCLTGTVDGQEVRFPLFKPRLTIGRTQSNDLQLSPNYISRRHAVIVTDGGATRIVDWGSRNGIKVNQKPVTEHFLKHGDVVSVGTFDFVYEERSRS